MKKNFIFLMIGVMFLLVAPNLMLACDSHDDHDDHDDHNKPHFCSAPLSETRTVSCGAGYTGSITQTRTKSAYPGCNFGEWVETSNTCAVETYTVTASKVGNGSITPSTQEAGSGTTVNFTVTPDAGFHAVMGGTCPAGNLVGNSYTTGNIAGDCTVVATFESNPVDTYTVTATAGDNGTITPASQEAASGTTVIFTVTPSVGYIATVGGTCGGNLVGTTYTTNNITGDCTVEATFAKIPADSFVLTVETPGTGSGVVTGAGTYSSGTVVTLTATPASNSTFSGWSDNCPGGVVTMTSNTTCTATFTLKPVLGCMDKSANNYNENATEDDNSCNFKKVTHHSGGSTPFPTGKVLGESTTCGIYVDKFMKMGLKNNNMEAVGKVQMFLNGYMNANLKVDGIFGPKTDAALKAFQAKHADKVLDPWGLKAPTGIFYLTTQTEVNNIMCPPLNLPIPTLIPMEQNPSFPQF